MTNLKLEAMKLAFQAALQYGAFEALKLTPNKPGTSSSELKPTHNWGEHYEAIEGLADAIYTYINHVEKNPELDPRVAEIAYLHQMRGIQPQSPLPSDDSNITD